MVLGVISAVVCCHGIAFVRNCYTLKISLWSVLAVGMLKFFFVLFVVF
uniref:Uncharacterized protein n=1 Tax=Anguilla anguilla TaxID=7936 RepID=A0A0E9W6E0_ANGAN